MKDQAKEARWFFVIWILGVGTIVSLIYAFWWSWIYTGGAWFAIRLNSLNEFWLEFIALHIILIICVVGLIRYSRLIMKRS